MDLQFETPEAAARCAKSLRTWGEYMDQNADKQIIGEFYGPNGGTCAIGAAATALCGRRSMYFPHLLIAHNFGITFDMQDEVGRIAARQNAIEIPEHQRDSSVTPLMNDVYGVTFPQFAIACRALAAMIEERYVVDAAPVAEREMVEA